MKKFILSAVCLAMASISYAAVQPPLDLRGNSIYTADFVGVIPCVTTASTGVECTTGRGAVYGVIVSSDVQTNFLIMRDSGTANVTSSTMAFVYNQLGGNVSGSVPYYTFPRPIQFLNGLSINLNSGCTAGGQWTILYRPLKATE